MSLDGWGLIGADGATLDNSGIFLANSDQGAWYYPPPGMVAGTGARPVILNTGVFEKASGTGATQIGWSFDTQTGVFAASGQLQFAGGGTPAVLGEDPNRLVCPLPLDPQQGIWSASPGATLGFSAGCEELGQQTQLSGNIAITGGDLGIDAVQAPAGTLSVSAGTLHVSNPAVPATVGSLTLGATGQVTGPGELDICQSLQWTAGTMSGTGSTVLCPGSASQIDPTSGASVMLTQRTLRNNGTLSWTSGTILVTSAAQVRNHGVIHANSETGVLSCTPSDGTIPGSYLVNTDAIDKTGGAGPTDINCPTFNFAAITHPRAPVASTYLSSTTSPAAAVTTRPSNLGQCRGQRTTVRTATAPTAPTSSRHS